MCAALAILSVWSLSACAPAYAPISPKTSSNKVVIRNDRGGLIGDRIEHIQQLRLKGASVQIGPGYCYSSCTMYLGLEDVCVHPQTELGFHGPINLNTRKRLNGAQFERWTTLAASYYPPKISESFMNKWRYRSSGLYKFWASDLVRYGIKLCK